MKWDRNQLRGGFDLLHQQRRKVLAMPAFAPVLLPTFELENNDFPGASMPDDRSRDTGAGQVWRPDPEFRTGVQRKHIELHRLSWLGFQAWHLNDITFGNPKLFSTVAIMA